MDASANGAMPRAEQLVGALVPIDGFGLDPGSRFTL